MKVLNKIVIFLVLSLLVGCGGTPSIDRDKSIIHKAVDVNTIPKRFSVIKSLEPAPFFGELKTNPGGQSASMMYSGAAGFGGFLAQVLTHAAIANEMQNSELSKAQVEADEVLVKYQNYIDANTKDRLLNTALRNPSFSNLEVGLIDDATLLTDGLIIESFPAFYLSQNEQTITIKHQLKAFYAQAHDDIVFENMAQVISKSIGSNEEILTLEDEDVFMDTVNSLYNKSLEILIKDFYSLLNEADKQSTFKYYVGDKKFYLRGTLISNSCGKKIIRDLKGNIVVLPNGLEDCGLATPAI